MSALTRLSNNRFWLASLSCSCITVNCIGDTQALEASLAEVRQKQNLAEEARLADTMRDVVGRQVSKGGVHLFSDTTTSLNIFLLIKYIIRGKMTSRLINLIICVHLQWDEVMNARAQLQERSRQQLSADAGIWRNTT